MGLARCRHQGFAQTTDELAANLAHSPKTKPATLPSVLCSTSVLLRFLCWFRLVVFKASCLAVVGVVKDVAHASIEGKVPGISSRIGLMLLG
jgi:hypothetical protein